MAKYKPVTAKAAIDIIDNLQGFSLSVIEAGVQISNIALNAAEQESRRITPIHGKPYPPSRNRVPGTMRKSIRTIKATRDHPGKNIIDTWLFDWIASWNRRREAAGGALKVNRRVGKTKGIKRFGKMIKTDPRRLLGEPMEREINRRVARKLARQIAAAVDKASI